MSGLGDYDQCLELERTQVPDQLFEGNYCSVDMFPLIRGDYVKKRMAHNYDSKFSLDQVPVFAGFPLSTALCLPSNCDDKDVRQMMSKCKLAPCRTCGVN